MLFHTFISLEERKETVGSFVLEFQYCRLKRESEIDGIVSVDAIESGKDDSLYVSDIDRFYSEYSMIFDNGIYNNLERGIVDIYGINYYPPEECRLIKEKILNLKPTGYCELLNWAEDADMYNGIYILGV